MVNFTILTFMCQYYYISNRMPFFDTIGFFCIFVAFFDVLFYYFLHFCYIFVTLCLWIFCFIFIFFPNMYIFYFIVNTFSNNFLKGRVIMKKFSFLYKFTIISILLTIFLFINAVSYVNAVSSNLSDGVFRLHVIANSDSEEDQLLKYKVRDSLIKYMNEICKDVSSKQEAMSIAKKHIDDFYNIANDVIVDNGYDYPVNIAFGKYDFPTKKYGDISLPAGVYDALRVEIGTASGQNWWCVMFPPLCFVDVSSGIVPDSSKELLQENLPAEDYNLITDSGNSSELKFKFKLVELLENLKLKIASN